MSKLFAHEKLIQDNQINVAELDDDTKSFIKDFKATMQGVKMIAAKTGKVEIKPDTEAKLRRLDKVICDGILDYLDDDDDDDDKNTPPTPANNQQQPPTPPQNQTPPVNQNTPPADPPQDPPKKKTGFMMGIGFYDED